MKIKIILAPDITPFEWMCKVHLETYDKLFIEELQMIFDVKEMSKFLDNNEAKYTESIVEFDMYDLEIDLTESFERNLWYREKEYEDRLFFRSTF